MPFLVFAVLAWGSAALRIALMSSPDRTLHHALGILIVHSLSVIAGLGGLYAFLGHSFRSDEVAAGVGWPKGNPFQREVAVANLALDAGNRFHLDEPGLLDCGGFRLLRLAGWMRRSSRARDPVQ
jgi:hypothetical protein